MRVTSAQTQATWLGGDFTGSRRPMVRATIQRLSMCLRSYGNQTYSSMMFGQHGKPVELPNIKDLKWARSTDNGAATMTMTLFNTDPVAIGRTPEVDLDTPGAYTYQRGKTPYSGRWNHLRTGWQDWLVPDRIIRTYEGYGFNAATIPELDGNLYLSGTWLIDDVDLDATGMITVTCRDLGRALLDQICMPPIVPPANYPLYFEAPRTVVVPPTVASNVPWFPPCWDSDSNQPTLGASFPYYPGAERHGDLRGPNVEGHVGSDAVDNSQNSYWLGRGSDSSNQPHSYEWVTLKYKPRVLGAVQFRTWGGPYRVYLSVMTLDNKWHGDRTIPYDPQGRRNNGAAIPYIDVIDVPADDGGLMVHAMTQQIPNSWKVRLTFTDLMGTGGGKYRSGLRYIRVSPSVTSSSPGTTYTEPTSRPPRYDDYTEIVKHLLAWAGWFWPQEPAVAVNARSDGHLSSTPAPSRDPVLASGRVWGDLQQTGTRGISPLGVSFFDKKPVGDVINAVRDTVGFLFFIDEGGGAVFRPPNIWSVGNWIGNAAGSSGRTNQVVTIDEEQTMMTLGAKLSSRSIRERVFVGNLSGQVGAVSPGHNPYPSGLRRVGGWTDQHFTTAQECQIMADLITLRQLFTYRTDQVTIPGNPAIQCDDQVRLFERITEEGYLHYVTDIQMNWSIETGKYTYGLGTHWLGDTPFQNWTFDPAKLAPETQYYLKALGVYK